MRTAPARPATTADVIYTRRSVRSYTGHPIDKPTIAALLDAAVQAPTAMHMEPWGFVVIQDPSLLRKYSERVKAAWLQEIDAFERLHAPVARRPDAALVTQLKDPAFDVFYKAGTLIVICAKAPGDFVVADCWLAAQNLMLAATALGLGTCCIGSAVKVLNTPEVRAELGLHPATVAIAPIVVGEPAGEPAASPRHDPVVLAWH